MSRVINAGHFQAAKVELSAHPMDRLELFWFARYVRPCMYPDASLQKGWASVNGKSSRLGQDKASRPVQARPACKFGLCPGTTGRSVGGVGPLVLRVLPNLAWKEMEVAWANWPCSLQSAVLDSDLLGLACSPCLPAVCRLGREKREEKRRV